MNNAIFLAFLAYFVLEQGIAEISAQSRNLTYSPVFTAKCETAPASTKGATKILCKIPKGSGVTHELVTDKVLVQKEIVCTYRTYHTKSYWLGEQVGEVFNCSQAIRG